jgi:hypothetical protein
MKRQKRQLFHDVYSTTTKLIFNSIMRKYANFISISTILTKFWISILLLAMTFALLYFTLLKISNSILDLQRGPDEEETQGIRRPLFLELETCINIVMFAVC